MGVRLKNVDEIVTSGGQTLDVTQALTNLSVAAGGGANVMKITLSSSVTNYYFGENITFNTVTYPMLDSPQGGTAQVAKGEYAIDGGSWTQFTSGGTNASFTINETAVVDKNSAPAGYSEQKTISVRMTDDLGNVSYKEMFITMGHLDNVVADYLLVAGGGAGGHGGGGGGGGGAGGLLIGQHNIVVGTNLYVEIGNGGTSAHPDHYWYTEQVYPGSNSMFDTFVAIGGGGGTYGMRETLAADSGFNKGGSGGGGNGGYNDYGGYGYNTTNAAAWGNPSSMINQGNDGAAGSFLSGQGYHGGGGGGAGSAGGDGSSTTRTNTTAVSVGRTGGAGVSSDITGTLLWYAGGGAGGAETGGTSNGGSGVGGDTNQNGAVNTGSGGGGKNNVSNEFSQPAGNGGSGALILLVPTTVVLDSVDASLTINGTGGSTTPPAPQTGRNGDNLYIITAGSGNISFKTI